MDLTPYYAIVNSCVKQLGVDPEDIKGDRPGSWSLVRGSARVWIDVWHIKRENRPYIQVMSPVMMIPENNQKKAALFEELLAFNDRLFGCAFTIFNDFVWLKSIRECEGLDESEAMAMLTRIGNYADDYDDYLKEKYEPQNQGGYAGLGPTPGGASDN